MRIGSHIISTNGGVKSTTVVDEGSSGSTESTVRVARAKSFCSPPTEPSTPIKRKKHNSVFSKEGVSMSSQHKVEERTERTATSVPPTEITSLVKRKKKTIPRKDGVSSQRRGKASEERIESAAKAWAEHKAEDDTNKRDTLPSWDSAGKGVVSSPRNDKINEEKVVRTSETWKTSKSWAQRKAEDEHNKRNTQPSCVSSQKDVLSCQENDIERIEATLKKLRERKAELEDNKRKTQPFSDSCQIDGVSSHRKDKRSNERVERTSKTWRERKAEVEHKRRNSHSLRDSSRCPRVDGVTSVKKDKIIDERIERTVKTWRERKDEDSHYKRKAQQSWDSSGKHGATSQKKDSICEVTSQHSAKTRKERKADDEHQKKDKITEESREYSAKTRKELKADDEHYKLKTQPSYNCSGGDGESIDKKDHISGERSEHSAARKERKADDEHQKKDKITGQRSDHSAKTRKECKADDEHYKTQRSCDSSRRDGELSEKKGKMSGETSERNPKTRTERNAEDKQCKRNSQSSLEGRSRSSLKQRPLAESLPIELPIRRRLPRRSSMNSVTSQTSVQPRRPSLGAELAISRPDPPARCKSILSSEKPDKRIPSMNVRFNETLNVSYENVILDEEDSKDLWLDKYDLETFKSELETCMEATAAKLKRRSDGWRKKLMRAYHVGCSVESDACLYDESSPACKLMAHTLMDLYMETADLVGLEHLLVDEIKCEGNRRRGRVLDLMDKLRDERERRQVLRIPLPLDADTDSEKLSRECSEASIASRYFARGLAAARIAAN